MILKRGGYKYFYPQTMGRAALNLLKYRLFGILVGLSIILFLSGCQTATSAKSQNETNEDVSEALSAVAGALSGKQLSKEEIQNLEEQIRTDEEAQTAIKAITDSVGKTSAVKYCPVTGRRYAVHLEVCPEHQVQLEIVDP